MKRIRKIINNHPIAEFFAKFIVWFISGYALAILSLGFAMAMHWV